jgi:hypothetical protein
MKPSSNIYRHQHSLSTSNTGNQHFGSLFNHYGGARSAGGPRQSLDVTRSLAVNGPISPRPPGLSQLRPTSEILSAHGGALNAQPNQGEPSGEGMFIFPRSGVLPLSCEKKKDPNSAFFCSFTAEAIDKWFEDLQSYEATLEEMATASLDVNFQEEVCHVFSLPPQAFRDHHANGCS